MKTSRDDSVVAHLPRGAGVAVIRLRSLGDCVLTTPAIRILKDARPDLRIGVAVETRFATVFEGNPDVDEILAPGIPSVLRFRPKLVLNLHGGSSSARMTLFSGARFRAGFAHFQHGYVYNVRIPSAQVILGVERKVHTAEHLASAMFYLGVPNREIPGAHLFAADHPVRDIVKGAFAVFHPGASHPSKKWPDASFRAVALHVKRQLDLQPVFIGGTGEDLSSFQVWPTLSNAPLEEIKALLSHASLFVGNDSGPAHMAAAFGVPVVVLYGPSDPVIWAPWRTVAETISGNGSIERISEEQVLRALNRMRVHA